MRCAETAVAKDRGGGGIRRRARATGVKPSRIKDVTMNTRSDRYLSLILATGLTTSLAACGDSKADDDKTADPGDDDDDAGGDDDDDAGGGDDDDDGGSGTGEGDNDCVPGVLDCAEDEKCQPYVKEDGACCVDADLCVPVTGTKQHGEECTRERYGDDCAKDVFCFAGTSGKIGPGICRQLCDGTDSDSCADKGMPEAVCVPWNSGKLPMCEVPCHPLRPECDDGEGCYRTDVTNVPFSCAKSDPEPGKGKAGDDCYTVQSCNPGVVCMLGTALPNCESDYCCALYCDVNGDGTECEAPAACVPFYAEDADVDPSYLEVGYCGLAEE